MWIWATIDIQPYGGLWKGLFPKPQLGVDALEEQKRDG
jgi:hypothetical protein